MPTLLLDRTPIVSRYGEARVRQARQEARPAGPGRPGTIRVPGPLWRVNQLDQSFYAWDEFQNSANNCGPSCVCMVMDYAIGVPLGVDQVLDGEYPGGHRLGVTYVDDHVAYLNGHGVPTTSRAGIGGLEEFRQLLRAQVRGGYLAIVLGDFLSPNYGHFEVCYGVDEAGGDTLFLNPYHGTDQGLSWGEAWAHCQNRGGYVLCTRRGRHAYAVAPESWTAATVAGAVNVRFGPSTREGVARTAPAQTRYPFDYYTDDGEAIDGGDPPTRWHYSVALGGWVADAVLTAWARA